MKQPAWQPLELGRDTVPARPDGLWTMVYGYVEGPVKLRLKASGRWSYAHQRECGPDGARDLGLPQDVLLSGAPLGALIGKIGGSSADKPDGAKQCVFAVGSDCVVDVDAKWKGALFLTMNDDAVRFDHHAGELRVDAWEAP